MSVCLCLIPIEIKVALFCLSVCLTLATTHLVPSQDPEGVNDLFCRVGVHILPRHEVQEGVELDVAGGVGIHDAADALEVNLALPVLADGVAQRDEARLELIRSQPSAPEGR